MSRVPIFEIVGLSLLVIALGCDATGQIPDRREERSAEEWAAELAAPEEFSWDDQPIRFAPLPADWERQREQSGGLFGTRFVKYVSGGQSIEVAEFTAVGKRDRCTELEELLRDLDELDRREFMNRLLKARPYLGKDPLNASETEAFEAANERLDDARSAYLAGDFEEVRGRISAALWDLRWVALPLEDIVEPALFTGEGYDRMGRIEVAEPVDSEVAGKPAILLEYVFEPNDRDGVFHGKHYYVAHNNRLFVARFQGVDEYLPLFDAMVDSISFPPGACEH